jgi:NAD(P)-dependent dehydrogenase (short-subunit alcohol dehydrogenase family)
MKGPADMEGAEDTASYQSIFDVNVIGTVLGMKHGIKALRKRGGGSVVTVSSNGGGFPRGGCGGELGDMTFAIPYCITSASLDQIVRIAAFYQTENIRVYGIKPGVYASEMIDGMADDFKSANPEADEDAFSSDFNFFFKGIIGDPKHIGYIVETLVNNTTKYVPGSNISLDNDATYDAALTYAYADSDTVIPPITVDDLRGYDGRPYESKEERTADFIKNLEEADEE